MRTVPGVVVRSHVYLINVRASGPLGPAATLKETVMPVIALKEGYKGEMRDREENFHGQRLLYLGWEDHLMFCAPHCIPVDASMPFEALANAVLPSIYGMHPDWAQVNIGAIEWFHSNERFTPVFDRSLAENGLGHKSLIRFRTPGLNGIKGSCS